MITSQMSEHQRRIAEFMDKAGQDLPVYPTVPNEHIRRLRAKLIMEECLETVRALGFEPYMPSFGEVTIDRLQFSDVLVPSIEEIADGCADISVVTYGTLLACGIADKPIIEAVDASNLAKFAEGGYRRDDGKWMKSPNWEKPDIFGLLLSQAVGMLQGDCETTTDEDDDMDGVDDPTEVFGG